MTSEDRKRLSEIGYQVIDAKNEHVEKGWIVRIPNDDKRVLIAASEGDAWDAARDHHSEAAAAEIYSRLTAQSGEGRSGAGEDALREALELAKIKLRRYMDVHGPNGLNPDTYVGGYQAEIEAVLTTIDASLNARQSGEGEREADPISEIAANLAAGRTESQRND